MADRVLQRHDTAARWQQFNPVLAEGEIGIITDGAKGYKIGDGKTPWNSLPFPANPANVVQETGDSESAVMSQKAVTEMGKELDGKLNELESEVNGAVVESEVASAETIADRYMAKDTGKISTYTGNNLAIVKFPIAQGSYYKIAIAKTPNAAGYVLCYAETIGSIQTSPIVDKVGDRLPYEYSFVADKDGYLFVGISADSEYTNLKKLSIEKGLADKVEEVNAKVEDVTSNVLLIDKQINGEIVDVEVGAAETIADRYMVKETGKLSTYPNNNLAIVKFPISDGNSYKITIAKTTNAAGYVLCYAENLDSLQTTPIVDKIGDRQSYEYSFIAEADGYLFAGISADSEYTTLTKEERSDCIVKDIEKIKKGVGGDWSNKKWVVIGDSLSTLNSTTTKRYIDYIVEKTGIQVEVLAVGGSSWGQPQNNNNAFFQQAERVSADADIVTLFGSFNSWYKKDGDVITDGPTSMGDVNSEDVTTRYGCINTAFKNIYLNAPLARVGVIFPTPWKTANPYNVTETATSLISTLEAAAKRWGIPYLDLFHESGMRPWDEEYRLLVYSKDSGGIDGNPNGVHPNEIGHEIIASHVLAFMKRLLLIN